MLGHVAGIAKYLGLKKKETSQPVNVGVTTLVNGKHVEGAKLEGGGGMVPLRAVSEALGAQVDWGNNTKTATITN